MRSTLNPYTTLSLMKLILPKALRIRLVPGTSDPRQPRNANNVNASMRSCFIFFLASSLGMVPPMKTLLSVFVVFGFVVYCDALANPIQDFISKIQGPGSSSRPSTPLQPDGAKLLRELNLIRSTEPVLAGARAQQIPNLLTASIPAILRVGSGVFADGYQISLIDRDDTKYTYVAWENRQIQETGIYMVPNEPLILYELEACPFCRKVREACSSKYPKQYPWDQSSIPSS
jgi:hypothetical protein